MSFIDEIINLSSWFKKRNIFQRINKKPNHGCIWEEDILNSREGKKTYFNSLVSLKQNFIDNNDSSTGKFSENWSLRNSPPQFLGFLGNLCQGTGCLQCKQRSQDPKTHKHHFIQTSWFWRENMGNYFVL